jgi:predicted alpha/beta-fold hydrolase
MASTNSLQSSSTACTSLSPSSTINKYTTKRTKQRKGILTHKSPSKSPKSDLSSSSAGIANKICPDTNLGWAALVTSIASMVLYHERRLQRKLTCPPLIYSQNNEKLNEIRERLSHNPKSDDGKGILTREIKPSLLVGTRSFLASAAAYALHGPPREQHMHFREVQSMGDGATIALDWEVPYPKYDSTIDVRFTDSQVKANVLYGPIDLPVVIIMHGINNDTGFGYMKSLMRSCADKGWIACGMNFRGCGGQKMTTPRGYNAGYTGDIRVVVNKISARLKVPKNTPIFLVGNSLGANVMTKYLGEEGFSKSLPPCVHGGISLGNPLHINSENVAFPFNILLGAGVKRSMLQTWNSFSDMSSCFHFGAAVRQALLSRTISELDHSMSPYMIRNETTYPFTTKIGFKDGYDYWHDSSSNRYIPHVSVPLLKISSQDDFLVTDPALRSLSRCLENPNVLVVKTKCGGHLGWQTAPTHGFGVGKSWADRAMTDFIESILEMKAKNLQEEDGNEVKTNETNIPSSADIVESMYAVKNLQSKL